MPDEPQNTRRVGVYDRPASADRPSTRILAIVVVVVIAVVAAIYFLRGN